MSLKGTVPIKQLFFNILKYSIFYSALWLAAGCSQLEQKAATPDYRGSWIGTAEFEPFPELIFLNMDSLALAKMYYAEVDSFSVRDGQLKFTIDDARFKGTFTGSFSDSTLLKGTFKTTEGEFDASFIKLADAGLQTVAEYTGFYQLAEDHVVEVAPYMLDFSLAPLMVLDYKTGKKRVAFPTGNGWFTAGDRMLSTWPQDFKVGFASNEGMLQMEWQEEKGSRLGGRMRDLQNKKDIVVNTRDGVELHGTITWPETTGPWPLVVFTHSAGQRFRGNLLNDFIKLLPYYGIATLTYDKRGCGNSGGSYKAATYPVLASDLAQVLEYASKLTQVDAENIGLLGIDQAGLVMPAAAAQSKHASFMVNIAGSALTMEQQEYEACRLRMKADGFDEREIREALSYQKQMFAYLRGKEDSINLQNASDRVAVTAWRNYVSSFDDKNVMDWWRRHYQFSAVPWLQQLDIPQLVVYGEKDLVVPPDPNMAVMRRLLKHPESEIKVYPGANHLMLLGEKRGDFQFTEIEGYPAGLFSDIHQWIGERTGLANAPKMAGI